MQLKLPLSVCFTPHKVLRSPHSKIPSIKKYCHESAHIRRNARFMGFVGDTAEKIWDGFIKAIGAGLAAALGALCILAYQHISPRTGPTWDYVGSTYDTSWDTSYDSTFTPGYDRNFTPGRPEVFTPGRVGKQLSR
jgi:hypothetical protein